jgi:hypothetical protein
MYCLWNPSLLQIYALSNVEDLCSEIQQILCRVGRVNRSSKLDSNPSFLPEFLGLTSLISLAFLLR